MIHDTMNHTDYVEIIVLLTMCIKIESLSQAFIRVKNVIHRDNLIFFSLKHRLYMVQSNLMGNAWIKFSITFSVR